MLSNATEEEQHHLKIIKNKLKSIANVFSAKHEQAYGPFETSVSTGNPIAIGGTKFNRVWSGMHKGAANKQYAAQISFVINDEQPCLDIGFYFGRASGHNLTSTQRVELEGILTKLGVSLSNAITNDILLQSRYARLFDFGFTAQSAGNAILPNDWLNLIRTKTKSSQIVAKIYPDDFGIIESSIIDSFVSQVVFLMGAINEVTIASSTTLIKPLTPEQRAKEAERFSQIGQKGELFVMEHERNRLKSLGVSTEKYPRHIALESMHYGYDILSLDETGKEIHIEVKTTTRRKEDIEAKRFFISVNEFDFFSTHKISHRLYRVYDVENAPSIEILDLGSLAKKPNSYIVEY